jgi:LEA14-like dessication related protein
MLALIWIGCTVGSLDGIVPTVKFARLDLTELDFEHVATDFVFEVKNPNPVGIPLERFNYNLAFEGADFLSGDAKDQLALGPDGTSEMVLPVSLTFEGIYALIEAVRGEDTIGFALDGNFGFDSDLGPVDVNYQADDEYPALRIPKINLGKLKLQKFDVSGVEMALDFDVDNDHGSALGLHGMDFDLNIAGIQIGNGSVEELGSVEGASSKTFTLPINVDYASVIAAGADLLSGGKLDVQMDAVVDIDTPFGVVAPLTIDESGKVSLEDDR